MNAIVEMKAAPLSAQELREHKNVIASVVKSVMQVDVHYGKIPGTDKPSLYQAGADCLLTTFHIAPSFRVEELTANGHVRFRVTCIGTHQGSGIVLGEGIGECSSAEEKYKWRKAICDAEFAETPETHRRVKYAKGKNGSFYTVNQIRTEPADQANTALKMAAKRAKVAMTLNVLAASDFFTQDAEDIPPEQRDQDGQEPSQGVRQPRAKSANEPPKESPKRDGTASDGEKAYLRNKLSGLGIEEAAACEATGVASLDTLTADGFIAMKDWVREQEKARD